MSFTSIVIVSVAGALILGVLVHMSLSQRKQQQLRERKQKRYKKQLRNLEQLKSAISPVVLPTATHIVIYRIELQLLEQLKALQPKSNTYDAPIAEVHKRIAAYKANPRAHSLKDLKTKQELQNTQSTISNICKTFVTLNKQGQIDLKTTQQQLQLLRPINTTVRVKIYLHSIDEARNEDNPQAVEHYLNQARNATQGLTDPFSAKVHSAVCKELKKIEAARAEERARTEKETSLKNNKWAIFDKDGHVRKRSIYD